MEIRIDNPCNQINWTKMSDIEKGKFCTICTKEVLDFRSMKDAEIISILNNSPEYVCARLHPKQMNRILAIENPHKIKHWKKILALSAMITLPHVNYANDTTKPPSKTELHPDILLDKIEHRENSIVDTIPKTISGKVIEESTDLPVYTSISIKGTSIVTNTDSQGNFKITVPSEHKKEVILVVESTGLDNDREFIYKLSELPVSDLVIRTEVLLIGEVIVIKRKKWWQFWKKK